MAQICTTREQSKKLLELGIGRETADMFYPTNSSLPEVCDNGDNMQADYPAWSLGALIDLILSAIDDCVLSMNRVGIGYRPMNRMSDSSVYFFGDDIFELCIKMIEHLVVSKYI